jgi:transposase
MGVAPLIEDLNFDALIGDMAFDSNSLIADLNGRGAQVVIAQHPRRASPRLIDKEVYKWRYLVENFFGKLKEIKISAASCEEYIPKTIQAHRHAQRQNRSELRRHDPSRRRCDTLQVNLNKP